MGADADADGDRRLLSELRTILTRFCIRVLLIGVKVALLLVGLEVAMRCYAWWSVGPRLVVADSVLGWRTEADVLTQFDSDTGPFLIRTNKQGLRDRDYPFQRAADTARIVVAGGSDLFGISGLRRDEILTEVLEKSLVKTEVINLGTFGYGPDQMYHFLAMEGMRYQPDLVIHVLGASDEWEAYFSFHPVAKRPKGYIRLTEDGDDIEFVPPSFPWWYTAAQHSYLLGNAERWVIPRLSDEAKANFGIPKMTYLPSDEQRRESLRCLLLKTRDLCTANGAGYLVVYIPIPGAYEMELIQEVLDELRKTGQIESLDMMQLLYRALRLDDGPNPYHRDNHLSAYGHRLVAQELHAYLAARGVRTSAAIPRD